ncbi:hypothetical protein C8R48DRAFT_684374, partial [Suillus tomentosus]
MQTLAALHYYPPKLLLEVLMYDARGFMRFSFSIFLLKTLDGEIILHELPLIIYVLHIHSLWQRR